jgi:hypothetical protein
MNKIIRIIKRLPLAFCLLLLILIQNITYDIGHISNNINMWAYFKQKDIGF